MVVKIFKTSARTLQHAHELLFTLNLSIVVLFVIAARSTPNGMFQIARWKAAINGYFGLHPHNDLGAYIGLLFWAILIALLTSFALQAISPGALSVFLLRWFAGISSFAAVPAAWLAVFEDSPWLPLEVNVRVWCPLELCFIGSLILLALRAKRKMRTPALVLLFCAHYGFWLWLFIERFGNYSALLPIIGLIASLIWLCFDHEFYQAETSREVFA